MAMHSNWNPWHGCIKCSEGCQNCYVYYSDRLRGKNAAEVYKTKTGFRYPLSKDRKKQYNRFDEDNPKYPLNIILDKNFRSRREVCDTVNFIFSRLMSEPAARMD